jgi:hypothetical protein
MYITYLHENRTMKLVEVVLRRGAGKTGMHEGWGESNQGT